MSDVICFCMLDPGLEMFTDLTEFIISSIVDLITTFHDQTRHTYSGGTTLQLYYIFSAIGFQIKHGAVKNHFCSISAEFVFYFVIEYLLNMVFRTFLITIFAAPC